MKNWGKNLKEKGKRKRKGSRNIYFAKYCGPEVKKKGLLQKKMKNEDLGGKIKEKRDNNR